MTTFDKLIKNIEKKTGMSIDEIRRKSPDEHREYFTRKTGRPFRITTEFPYIGRGNVLRDGLISSDSINKDIDRILGL